MKLSLVALADGANISQEGKLNILGVFDAIGVQELPAVHSGCYLVARLIADPTERGTHHALEFRMDDPDGQPQFQGRCDINVPEDAAPGRITINLPMPINGIRFEQAGPYEIPIILDGQVIERLSLDVHLFGRPGAESA